MNESIVNFYPDQVELNNLLQEQEHSFDEENYDKEHEEDIKFSLKLTMQKQFMLILRSWVKWIWILNFCLVISPYFKWQQRVQAHK